MNTRGAPRVARSVNSVWLSQPAVRAIVALPAAVPALLGVDHRRRVAQHRHEPRRRRRARRRSAATAAGTTRCRGSLMIEAAGVGELVGRASRAARRSHPPRARRARSAPTPRAARRRPARRPAAAGACGSRRPTATRRSRAGSSRRRGPRGRARCSPSAGGSRRTGSCRCGLSRRPARGRRRVATMRRAVSRDRRREVVTITRNSQVARPRARSLASVLAEPPFAAHVLTHTVVLPRACACSSCPMPKAACTSILWALAELAGHRRPTTSSARRCPSRRPR